MFRFQYIACNTDMYDAEAFTIYNMIEAITVNVRYDAMKRPEIVTRSCQNINQHKILRHEYTSTYCQLLLLLRTHTFVTSNPYIGKLLQREIRDLSGRKPQVFLWPYNYKENISILNGIQFVPKCFVSCVADHLTLK